MWVLPIVCVCRGKKRVCKLVETTSQAPRLSRKCWSSSGKSWTAAPLTNKNMVMVVEVSWPSFNGFKLPRASKMASMASKRSNQVFQLFGKKSGREAYRLTMVNEAPSLRAGAPDEAPSSSSARIA
ncbi:hypothetical protein E3N88_13732 [Mikania micrantha]|uniref:Uncharacterized protein n=1 Tax=Mikania micrantha TaxID=192012 RepID=A0A5N6NZS7_9ASTR|nr:hypothetical protein E3N88_13732 [Mikania micrantha]